MARKNLECRLERLGASLPESLRVKPLEVLWGPLLFDWLATLFTVGYSIVLWWDWGLWFAGGMAVAGVVGLYGLYKLRKRLRMLSSWVLALSYAYMALLCVSTSTVSWPMAYLFAAHAVMEVVVYFRCATDPRHYWGD